MVNPKHIGGDFDCGYNDIQHLIYFPEHIGGFVDIYGNKKLNMSQNITDINIIHTFKSLYLEHIKQKTTQDIINLENKFNKDNIQHNRRNKI